MKQALIGNGGHAREVMAQMGNKNIIRFIDDQYWKNESNTLPLSQFNPDEYEVMIAVGDSRNRFDISQKLPQTTKYFTFIHPTVLIMDDMELGEGSFIGAYSILTTNIKIGKHALLNRAVHIGHDSIIGDYFSAMPGSIISGNVTICDCVYLGTNSSIKEKISIHSLTTIGSNATVTKHINEPGTYVGVPVKKIK
jgi:sugar O-acyltransferase (sialic acid O-acetyltransferase NeuD family)